VLNIKPTTSPPAVAFLASDEARWIA